MLYRYLSQKYRYQILSILQQHYKPSHIELVQWASVDGTPSRTRQARLAAIHKLLVHQNELPLSHGLLCSVWTDKFSLVEWIFFKFSPADSLRTWGSGLVWGLHVGLVFMLAILFLHWQTKPSQLEPAWCALAWACTQMYF